MRRFASIGVFLGLLLLGAQVCTAAVSYDLSAQGYINGQALEGTTLGAATFTSESTGLSYDSVKGGFVGNVQGTSDIYISFSSPIDMIAVTASDGGGDYDRFALSLYQYGTNAFLGTTNTPEFDGGSGASYELSLSAPCVGAVVFDPGNGSFSSGSVTLPGLIGGTLGLTVTDFTYNVQTSPCPPIPAPGALLLCGLGAPVVAWLRRRRVL